MTGQELQVAQEEMKLRMEQLKGDKGSSERLAWGTTEVLDAHVLTVLKGADLETALSARQIVTGNRKIQ